MDLAIGILTIFLVLDALFLVLLILLQLPKKEAGLGTAFGGGATDALFGAGAGNVLTKLTTWGAVIFLVLALALSIMHKSVGEKRRNLGLNQPTPTNAVSTILPEKTNATTLGTGNTTTSPSDGNAKPAVAKGNATTTTPASKSKTEKAPEEPKVPAPKTPPAKTKKSDKAPPPAKGKTAPPPKK